MKKYLLYTLFCFSCFLIFTSGTTDNNGKAGRAGSPGEQTCVNGCHSSYALNSGPGSSVLTSNIPNNEYSPGQTYTMTLTITHPGDSLFGLGVEALSTANANAGTLTPGAGTTTKSATISGTSRKSITHLLNGGAGTVGSHTFTFTWLAPAVGTGNVTFYCSGVAANRNNSNSLDYVYNNSQVFTEYVAPSSVIETQTEISSLQIFSNPVRDNLSFSYVLENSKNISSNIYSLNGSMVKEIFNELQTEGLHTYSTDITALSKGIYFLQINVGKKSITKKLVVQ